jgi:cell division cycle protein 37
MSKLSFDYSKWDRLELSDDEDSFHPNLDKNLNIRVNRITRDRKEEELDEDIKKAVEVGDHKKAAQVEAKRPLHVGNLCRVAEERTIINRSDGSRKDRIVTGEEEFHVDEYVEFKRENQQMLDEYANADWPTSRKLLHAHGDILLDDCANSYFMLNALEEEMAGNNSMV